MRRIISFILALGLTAAGAVWFVYMLLFGEVWYGRMFMGAGLLLAVGVVWLYSDYIDATPNQP
jgi:hypothetical protein